MTGKVIDPDGKPVAVVEMIHLPIDGTATVVGKTAADGTFKVTVPLRSPGAYLFPRAPWGSGTEFVSECIRNNLLLIPGNVFSRADTHFRLSYAAADHTIDRGLEILNRVARR